MCFFSCNLTQELESLSKRNSKLEKDDKMMRDHVAIFSGKVELLDHKLRIAQQQVKEIRAENDKVREQLLIAHGLLRDDLARLRPKYYKKY